ncbi:zinc finger protein 438 isoform X2 [Poecile atricapillus]|uniref:zinc finger protein 438 isoform X2 n=3 Tax=Poecile atricapillus TaxID=48891 RepID=UPI002738E40D|nr:zinc finger protein 438 isoform X2 [Poecile atricapillus]XP_058688529.1 zinc finger protein 438 isoform X2 [Poecile atricapillus]XP_058688530.1 zinc finger protein 438 isoform X2 [Poecile atricapillus]XP_058688531.1 zinc finger protein 438 isoform X2 [Poecile atricapillus]XP_058688532.1 zinc finger protein 438 isoform X2 [Poecile atricapillus]XP_058688533.1 zinc finger protein 438 isoform X2 [Poecile atricapillus]XP_058688535.1 zinc finger protein 438 isoform X2 [Poecile atricapillus]
MQNPLTVSAGGVFLHANPAEKHCVQQSMLGQQKQETCAAKTVSTDKQKSPSDLIQSFQKKSQFRTIAPKMVPKILTSGVVSCHQSSLPEPVTPISSSGSKPLVVPAQNYAVMQVAAHKGTFSLLAVPCVAPALTQQVQQSTVAPSENLKLPIPRYQSVRNKLLSDKKPAQISGFAWSACNKIPTKTLISSQTSLMTALPEDCPEAQSSSDSAEQGVITDCDSAEIGVATLVNKSNRVESRSLLMKKTEIESNNVSGPTVVEDSLSKPSSTTNPMKLSLHSVKTASETTREPLLRSEKLKEKPTNSVDPFAVLSPAVFGSTIQMTSSAPKGKLPILPYSRMENSVFCRSKQNTKVMDTPGHSLKSECEKIPSLMKAKAFDNQLGVSFTQVTKQTIQENTSSPSSKVGDVDSLKKLNSATSKRRGRKKRAPEDLLAFQAKQRKCIINKFREERERAKIDIQAPEDNKAEAVKKYRSIRPKPVVVVQAFAPLAPAAIVETPSHEQDLFLNGSLANKCLSSRHSDATSAKSSDLSRNTRSAVPKPLHRCHVCNHTFQFKHHLQDHMNTHTRKRPYSCRICRKAYIYSGRLSTHMKLHHNEGKPKKLVCCEFCAKVFGHAKVYFGHLREVHRVVISTEPSTSEQQVQDTLKNRDRNIKEAEEATERGNNCNFEDLFHNPGGVKLQVKCGRCQFIAESFGEMKFHLLCCHGEEIQGRVKEGVLQGSRGTKGGLVKHTTHVWKQHDERRRLAKCSARQEELYTVPKPNRQIPLHHHNNVNILPKSELTQSGNSEASKEMKNVGFGTPRRKIEFWSKAGYNCILCEQLFGRKEDLFNHWQSHHNCEDPSTLWTVFTLVSKQRIIELSDNGEY